MIEVTLANFEIEVIEASVTVPVLVDFWAPWCGPCQSLGPLLEQLEISYQGRFKLVKINTEQEPQLGAAFGVRSIPTCILMINGQPKDGFMGALPESQIRAFLDPLLPELAEPEIDQAPVSALDEALTKGDIQGAIDQLQLNLKDNPLDDEARFDLIRLLLQHRRLDEAQSFIREVDAQRSDVSPRLLALFYWVDALEKITLNPSFSIDDLKEKTERQPRDLESHYALTQGYMAQQDWALAMDTLFEILIRDKNNEKARQTWIAILDIIDDSKSKKNKEALTSTEDPLVTRYRRRLSSLILS